MNSPIKRFLSIDVFRALIMFLMIFINEISNIKGIPSWIDHAAATEDGMGLADFIFPAFIFITGLSIPLAISNRMKRNDSDYEIYSYITMRSAALIIIGFFQVNLDEYSSASLLPKQIWALIVTSSFFLIWLNYPRTLKKTVKYSLIGTGLLLLLIMAFLYKSQDSSQIISMQPMWWGIIGIIGWTYLTCGIIYYIFKKSFTALIIIFIFFACINIAQHLGFWEDKLWLIDDASYVTLAMGGIVCSVFYNKVIYVGKSQKIWIYLTILAVILISSGYLLRPYAEGISKISSTPAWVFISLGVSIFLFEVLIYWVDKLKQKDFFKIIRPAGTSTLTCYMMPYFLMNLMELFNIKYPVFLNEGVGGILRGLAIAFLLIWIVGQMEKKKWILKI